MWRRLWWSRTMRGGDDRIVERRRTPLGGELLVTLGARRFRVEFLYGAGPVRYAIDREHCYDEVGARVDDDEFTGLADALSLATRECFGRGVTTFVPSSAVFELHFVAGMSPFGSGRRVFVEGRLADLMRPHIGCEDVTFEYPVRVDGGAPQPVRIRASALAGLEPIA